MYAVVHNIWVVLGSGVGKIGAPEESPACLPLTNCSISKHLPIVNFKKHQDMADKIWDPLQWITGK